MSHIKVISILSAIREEMVKGIPKPKQPTIEEIKKEETERTYIGGEILRFEGFELW